MSALQGLVNVLKACGRKGRRELVLAALASASLMSSEAHAGPPAPVPYAYDWSGFYAGVNAGLGGGSISPLYELNGVAQPGFPGSQGVDEQHHRMGGFVAGGQAGYNRQFGNHVVLGIETDLQWSNIGALHRDNSNINYDIGGFFPIRDSDVSEMKIRQNWFGTTRLRAGYAFSDRFLAYATGGIAYSNFSIGNSGLKTEFIPFPGPFANIEGSASSTKVGWAAGAGFEVGLTSRLSLKSEYLYTAYPGFTAPYVDHEGSDPHLTTGMFSTGVLGFHVVRAGLNYRFQDSEAVSLPTAPATPAWTPTWTGFYAGVNGGYGGGMMKPNTSQTSVNVVNGFPGTFSEFNAIDTASTLRSGGFQAGVQFGYNRELPNRFVAGFETDFQWSGVRASRASTSLGNVLYNPAYPYSAHASLDVSQNWFGTSRLRLGYRPTDRLLAYATGGIAYSGFSAGLSSSFFDAMDGPAVGSSMGWSGATRIGWAAGTGVEYALWRDVSFKTEYLYTQYGGFNLPYQGISTDNMFYRETAQGVLSTATIGIHLIRGGLNWKIGG